MNGHLGVIMNISPYVIRAGQPFVEPIHPGVQAHHAANAMQAQITAGNRLHDKAKSDYNTYSKFHETIKQQIMTAVKTIYYQGLKDDDFSYANVTIPNLITYLTNKYGQFNAADLENNRSKLTEQWGTPTSRLKTSGNASASSAALLLPLEALPSPMAPQSSSP
jgi:hypothetical protein